MEDAPALSVVDTTLFSSLIYNNIVVDLPLKGVQETKYNPPTLVVYYQTKRVCVRCWLHICDNACHASVDLIYT